MDQSIKKRTNPQQEWCWTNPDTKFLNKVAKPQKENKVEDESPQ